MTKKKTYDNDSISSLKGADRVRKRPGVIFGSDGLEGCEHAMFEILSNAIDEARAGYGRLITVTRFADLSIQVEDQGRGCPVDWNEKEGRYNWELVFCELYAGGKYDNENSDNYEYSLGLNGLGSCATQYASRYMDVTVCRDGKEYRLHFEQGEIAGEMRVTNTQELTAKITELIASYNAKRHLERMRALLDTSMSESQFAQMVGKARLYQFLSPAQRKQLPEFEFTDCQLNVIARAYYNDTAFACDRQREIDLWRVFNLFTGANKSSYIDSFLARSRNASVFTEGVAKALIGEPEYRWFVE